MGKKDSGFTMKGFFGRNIWLLLALAAPWDLLQAAVRLSDDGQGEVLIFPFYSAASREESHFVIRNHEAHAKALHLRFREGLSGAEVLAFNVYLGPGESFEGAILKDPNGNGAAVASTSAACTVPELGSPNSPYNGFTVAQADGRVLSVQPFVPWVYSGGYKYPGDSNTDIRRTLVGSVEVIEMGQWSDSPSLGGVGTLRSTIYNDIVAGDCDSIVRNFVQSSTGSGVWVEDPSYGAIAWSGGGISGEMLITTSRGRLSLPPVALKDFARARSPAEYHGAPGTSDGPYPEPSLQNGSFSARLRDGSVVRAQSGLDALSILLAKSEFSVESSGSHITQDRAVIVSFPTKWLHSSSATPNPRAPFAVPWDPSASSACETIAINGGRGYIGDFPFTGVETSKLCSAINILAFPGQTADLAPEADWLTLSTPQIGSYPWVMGFADSTYENQDSKRATGGRPSFQGLPVIVVPLAVNASGGSWLKEREITASLWEQSSTDNCGDSVTTSSERPLGYDPYTPVILVCHPDAEGVAVDDGSGEATSQCFGFGCNVYPTGGSDCVTDTGNSIGSSNVGATNDSTSSSTSCGSTTIGTSDSTSPSDNSIGSSGSTSTSTDSSIGSGSTGNTSSASTSSSTGTGGTPIFSPRPSSGIGSSGTGSSMGSSGTGSSIGSSGTGTGTTTSGGSTGGSSNSGPSFGTSSMSTSTGSSGGANSTSDTSTSGGSSIGGGSLGDSSIGNTASASAHFSKLVLEVPAEGGVYSGIGSIQGWALDETGSLSSEIDLYVDGVYRGQIAHGDTRVDVGSAFPTVKQSRLSGFSGVFNFAELAPGPHQLEVVVKDGSGKTLRSSVSFIAARFSLGSFLSGEYAPRAGANTSCSMVDSTIRCLRMSVGDGTANVWLEWNPATQNFEITRIQ